MLKIIQKRRRYQNLMWMGIWLMTVVVLIYRLLNPFPTVESVPSLDLPETLLLQDWIFLGSGLVNSDRLHPPAVIAGQFIAGKHYRYRQGQANLDIEMTYLADTDGDLKSIIKAKTGNLWSTLRQREGVGVYSLYSQVEGDRLQVFLDTCINPLGGSTVTSDQFRRNRLLYDWQSFRPVGWVLGLTPVSDRRCLWTRMRRSIPMGQDFEVVAQGLEQDWASWYEEWRSRF